jgi:hypothetical protein
MEIPVLIEPVAGNGFRAQGGAPLALSAEGGTPDEALAKLRELLCSRLAAGAQIVSLELPQAAHPLAQFAGTLQRDDPLVQAWKESMAEYRQKVEEDPDYL